MAGNPTPRSTRRLQNCRSHANTHQDQCSSEHRRRWMRALLGCCLSPARSRAAPACRALHLFLHSPHCFQGLWPWICITDPWSSLFPLPSCRFVCPLADAATNLATLSCPCVP